LAALLFVHLQLFECHSGNGHPVGKNINYAEYILENRKNVRIFARKRKGRGDATPSAKKRDSRNKNNNENQKDSDTDRRGISLDRQHRV
jgi:hypothetical protein